MFETTNQVKMPPQVEEMWYNGIYPEVIQSMAMQHPLQTESWRHSWENHLHIGYFPAGHIWLPEDYGGIMVI